MEAKGKCSVCGNFVYGHEERWKNQDGSYVHLDCRLKAHGVGHRTTKSSRARVPRMERKGGGGGRRG
jgi:hypothetical protein